MPESSKKRAQEAPKKIKKSGYEPIKNPTLGFAGPSAGRPVSAEVPRVKGLSLIATDSYLEPAGERAPAPTTEDEVLA